MNRIKQKFNQLKNNNKKALIVFITAGFPDLATTLKLVLSLERSGVDIIELGVPFSDPLADGPVIQEASSYSLRKGTNLAKILNLVKQLRKNTDIPICLMTYYNPVFCFGEKRFVDQALASGVDGLIVPDLPPEEAKEFLSYADRCGLFNICFVSPTTSAARIKTITKKAKGFIYYVSTCGVTGKRNKLSPDLKTNLIRIKKLTTLPVCVGFGISTPQQAKAVSKISDGVIVGSAIVDKISKYIGRKHLVEKLSAFVKGFNA
ncbi:MAG: tryptophan synthase subunit alpha [Candidatus Omnitrophica bacterium]|nr:tryptophan synthase subunit alpha [Candidatus Omnitrophota bacterium]